MSLGGSPYDEANCQAAHRRCNIWRGNRPMAYVAAVRARALASFGQWRSPAEFVAAAKACEARAKGRPAAPPVRTTTDW